MGLVFNDLNTNDLNNILSQQVGVVEGDITRNLENFDPRTASAADMIQLQFGIQRWTLATQLHTNALKTIGDGIKSSVNNLR